MTGNNKNAIRNICVNVTGVQRQEALFQQRLRSIESKGTAALQAPSAETATSRAQQAEADGDERLEKGSTQGVSAPALPLQRPQPTAWNHADTLPAAAGAGEGRQGTTRADGEAACCVEGYKGRAALGCQRDSEVTSSTSRHPPDLGALSTTLDRTCRRLDAHEDAMREINRKLDELLLHRS